MNLELEPKFVELQKQVEKEKENGLKLKDTMLVISHKLLNMLDWKTNMCREYPKTKKKADILYKEKEMAEKELYDDIMLPDKDEVTPALEPFPNLQRIVKNNSKVSV